MLPLDRHHVLWHAINAPRPSPSDAHTLKRLEEDVGVGLAPLRPLRVANAQAVIEPEHVQALLAATQLVISGQDMQIYFDLFDAAGQLHEGFSAREWAAQIAVFANTRWPRTRAWTYNDFCAGSNASQIIAGYEDWLAGWRRLVGLKCELFGLPFGAEEPIQ